MGEVLNTLIVTSFYNYWTGAENYSSKPVNMRCGSPLIKNKVALAVENLISIAEMERHLGFYIKKELYDSFASTRCREPPTFPKS